MRATAIFTVIMTALIMSMMTVLYTMAVHTPAMKRGIEILVTQ